MLGTGAFYSAFSCLTTPRRKIWSPQCAQTIPIRWNRRFAGERHGITACHV